MLVSAVKQAVQRNRASYHWRRFHIDDDGHEGTSTEQDQCTIRIRFSRVPESMVNALCGLRAIEQQFGRIRDYRLLRVRHR